MPRLPRKFFQTSFFHVITQGINKSYIFNHDKDINKYINIMNKLSEEYHIEIIAYCIMNNHAHFLFKIETIENLSAYMHRLNATYAQYYNKKYNRVGFVFRNRFKSEGIFSEEYLYRCIQYIFNNPVKAKICVEPMDYKYSNCKEYILMNNYQFIKSDEDYQFMDIIEDKEEKCKEIIADFLYNKKRKIKQVLVNIELLKELIVLLYNNGISMNCMEKHIGVNRKRIKRLLFEDKIDDGL